MTTEHRDYNVPESGEEDWHVPVNENWEMIDADMQSAFDMARAALDAATEDEGDGSEEPTTDGGGTGFTWDQTYVDTSWLTDADENDELTVETVTNLDAGGSGSLAAALSAAEDNANTLVVFEVGGVIDNGGATYLRSRADNVYIAGQTAPYPGVTLVRGGLRIHGSNTIVQHMTILPGNDVDEPGKSRCVTYDDAAENVVVDHCTAAWAPDTNVNFRQDHSDLALINSINAEALNESSHPEAPHGYGTLVSDGTTGVAVMGNLMAHNWKRNPDCGREDAAFFWANNCVYNWGDRVCHMGDGSGPRVTWVGNAVEAGDDTDTGEEIFQYAGRVYYDDLATVPDGQPISDGAQDFLDDPPVWPDGLDEGDLVAANELEDFIAPMVGPRPADRDPLSRRIVDDWLSGGGRIIDDEGDVGGYPAYDAATRSLDPPSSGLLDWLQQYTGEVEGTAE